MEKQFKIVQATHAFPPSLGGIEAHVLELSLSLASLGAKVVVHTANAQGAKDGDAALLQQGVRVKRHFAIKLPFFSSAVFIPCITPMLAFEGADAYCAHGFGSPLPFFVSIAALLRGKPFYWTIHGMPKFRGKASIAPALYKLLAAPLPFIISKKIICVSQSVAEDVAKVGAPFGAGAKTVVIPNGISGDFFAEGKAESGAKSANPDAKSFTIAYVGRLDRSKGVHLLLDAFSDFSAQNKDAQLIYVGPDEGEKKSLQEKAGARGMAVEFKSFARNEMPSAYRSFSLTVLPSDYEGFGLSVLESWACGTPAISTPVGIAPEFFEAAFGKDEAKKFLFTDRASLVQRIKFIRALDAQSRLAYVKKARLALAKYSWQDVGKQTLAAFQG